MTDITFSVCDEWYQNIRSLKIYAVHMCGNKSQYCRFWKYQRKTISRTEIIAHFMLIYLEIS